MSFLPPAIPPRGPRGLPMPAMIGRPTAAGGAAGGAGALPVPVLVPTELPKAPKARAAVIEHIKAEVAEKPKAGRMSKDELKKMERAAMSEKVKAFAATKPSKKDVEEYLRARLLELKD